MNEHNRCSDTILVVDDTPTNLDLLIQVLSSVGYVVWTATTGERAIKHLQTHHPALILLDIQMPDMDGFETCRHIKANVDTASIPIIFMTAFSDVGKIKTGFALGAVDYISKPFQQAELFARIRTHLQLSALTQSLEQRVLERTSELQALEARQRMLFETSPVGLALCRMDGSLVDVNTAYAAIIGRTVTETLTLTYWDITPDTYVTQEQFHLKRLKQTGRYGPYEKEYIHKEGHLVPVQLSGVLLEQDGEQFIWSSVEDISERRRHEVERNRIAAKLELSEARATAAFSQATVGFVESNMKTGQLTLVNPYFCEMTGYSEAELLRMTVADLTHPADMATSLQSIQQLFTGQIDHFAVEKRYVRKDSSWFWAETTVYRVRLQDRPDTACLALVQDISRKKRLEAERHRASIALQESQRRYVDLISAVPVGIFRQNVAKQNIYVNERLCAILGLSHQAAMTDGWQRGLHPDDRDHVLAQWERSAREGRPFQLEYRFLRPDGIVKWLYSQYFEEKDADGQVVGYVGSVTDISDRKQAEITLQNLVAGTAATTGQYFFPASVHYIAEALDVPYVVISERLGQTNQILALWADGRLQPSQRYPLKNTPCEEVLKTGEYYCAKSLKTHFPNAAILDQLDAESYLGFALRSTQGAIIGNLCILDKKPLPDPKWAKQVLHIFTARAAAELERQRVQTSLETLNRELETKVTERTSELQASQAYYQGIIADQTELICRFLPDNSLTFVNDAYCQFFQATISDLLGKPFHFPQPLLKNISSNAPSSSLQPLSIDHSVTTYEHQATTPNGTLCWHQWTKRALFDADGVFLEFQAVGRDITALKEAEILIQRQLNTIEASIDGLGILRHGRYVFLNQSQLDLFGYAHPGDLLGQLWQNLYKAAEIKRFEDDVFPHVYQHGFWRGEAMGQCRDGRSLPVEVSLTLTPTGNIICVYRDISERRRHEAERKRAEEQIRQSMAQLKTSNQELESFAYSVSHDLRAPLRAIDGFSQALLEDYGDLFNEEGRNYFERIRINISRMGILIDDLLRLSRVSRSELHYETVNLSAIAQEVLHELQHSEPERQVDVIVVNEAIVSADPALMQVVLMNLLDNAWKFTRHHPTAHIEFGKVQKGEEIVYFVRDDGAGFDMTYSKKLFGVFQRLHSTHEFPGTGIGLATVQRAIHRHGGQVWAEAAVEKGAVFFFKIPTPLFTT